MKNYLKAKIEAEVEKDAGTIPLTPEDKQQIIRSTKWFLVMCFVFLGAGVWFICTKDHLFVMTTVIGKIFSRASPARSTLSQL